jgi:hypothetical protein
MRKITAKLPVQQMLHQLLVLLVLVQVLPLTVLFKILMQP